MTKEWRSCFKCGNRFPVGEGYGKLGEFCSAGCYEEWVNSHPGYFDAIKARQKKQTIKYLIIGFIVVITIFVLIIKCMISI